ncbi:MAG: hypothetical protein JWP91_1812 [Fibrobacteres bacterium]|nr:hypothetical protein [Fibrobacterota bacterium]
MKTFLNALFALACLSAMGTAGAEAIWETDLQKDSVSMDSVKPGNLPQAKGLCSYSMAKTGGRYPDLCVQVEADPELKRVWTEAQGRTLGRKAAGIILGMVSVGVAVGGLDAATACLGGGRWFSDADPCEEKSPEPFFYTAGLFALAELVVLTLPNHSLERALEATARYYAIQSYPNGP